MMSAQDLPSDVVRKILLLLQGGQVRELAAASFPHIHGGSGTVKYQRSIRSGYSGKGRQLKPLSPPAQTSWKPGFNVGWGPFSNVSRSTGFKSADCVVVQT